jgi:choline dehydrogenase-like flavoprotein
MTTLEADIAVVGSGVAGLLAVRRPLAAGRRVVMVERGALKTHAESLRDGDVSADVPGARPNHETADGSRAYPWSYAYGVGGSSLHWTGNTPRFQPADFEMRSRYGVMTDWPFGLDELEPYYSEAERTLGVAGGAGMAPHPLSPMDRLVARPLAPFGPLPQARPTRPVGRRPACCGSATCELCPVDSRFSALNGLGEVIGHERLELLTETAAARVRLDRGRRATGLDCVRGDGSRITVRARDVVVAAGGFESPALLLRSGLERPATGRYLFDHAHVTLLFHLRRDTGAGHGNSLSTGLSRAFADGRFRARHSAAIVIPYNPGIRMDDAIADELAAGREGRRLRAVVLERWRRTLPLDLLLEDVPQAGRRVTLGSRRDAFGLPFVRVAYPASTRYERDGIAAARSQLERRLAPLGVEEVRQRPGPAGAHLLGTCRMGEGNAGVVDSDLRHLDVDGLHVVGGAVFPTYTPAHPTLTIAALALRLGDRLARAG